jgi:ribonucleoside-diphosphate reductase beta chain
MSLLGRRTYYKPFSYPWAYEGYKLQQQMHWLPEEVPLREDVRDWNQNLSTEEKHLLTNIFRFFTQGDVDVAKGYLHKYIPMFGHNPEVAMMLSAFANMEAIHQDAYSLLLDTVGIPELEYQAFSKYKELADKHNYVEEITELQYTQEYVEDNSRVILYGASQGDKLRATAKSLAVYSAFTEGLQLFSSFAILLNFQRFNKMKGMGQIVTFSVKDESLHVEYMIKLFRTFIEENPEVWTDDFKKELYDICRTMVELEDNFIDFAFEMGGIEGLTKEEVKKYIRYIADRRLLQLGLKPNYKVKTNPLPWLEALLGNTEHANFFETRSTEYSKALIQGWDKVWESNL